ncbi:hypothetical protein ABZY09_25005 [Streptomyces sp. NPDC002928]|uniref:hypothetical protein n=1 Tax=Streptomyces sp. NPDC002928 TaxID=3154440 RepID=UPI0033A3B716
MIAIITANPGDREPPAAPLLSRLRAAQKRRTVTGTNPMPTPDVRGAGHVKSYVVWQQKLEFSGADVDGIPVKSSWARLNVPGI